MREDVPNGGRKRVEVMNGACELWLCYVNYRLLVLFCYFSLFEIFLSFLDTIGCMDIFLELVVLGVNVIWYGLKSLVRWVVPAKRKDISGRTAVVTGAGHGIGKLIAIGLANKGKT